MAGFFSGRCSKSTYVLAFIGVVGLIGLGTLLSYITGGTHKGDSRSCRAHRGGCPTTTSTTSTTTTPTTAAGSNVSAFGATGDGVTNDTAALQAAFNSGGDVFSDPGKTFLVTATLVLSHGADFNGSTVKGAGVISSGTDARLSNVTITGAFIGIRAETATRLVCVNCTANQNSYGVYVAVGALAGTSISGSATLNAVGLELHSLNGGAVPQFAAKDNSNFGVVLYDTAGWHFGQIESDRNGCTAGNKSGTGVELWRSSHDNTFDKITALQNPGYALAVNHASNSNTFAEVYADNTGGCGGDPGISFVDGSSGNLITKATVIASTVGLRFGENDSGTDRPVTLNIVDTYIGTSLAYGGIRFEHGDGNRVNTATLTDIQSVWQPWVRAAVEFSPLSFSTTNNVVASLSMFGALRPSYGVHFGANASGNSVIGNVLYTTGRVLDESGGKNTSNVTG